MYGMGLIYRVAAVLTRMCATVAIRGGSVACGGLRSLALQEHSAKRYRSRWWFSLPLTLNLLGGIIAYCAIRHDDPDKAKNCLLVGLAIFTILLLPWIIAVVFAVGMD
jgi:hypothetical protein